MQPNDHIKSTIDKMSTASEYGLIDALNEVLKQRERWGADHDDKHDEGHLAYEAVVMLLAYLNDLPGPDAFVLTLDGSDCTHGGWGLADRIKLPRRRLAVAAALAVAESDRRARKVLKGGGGGTPGQKG